MKNLEKDCIEKLERLVLHVDDFYCRKTCIYYFKKGSCNGCGFFEDVEDSKNIIKKYKAKNGS